VLAAELDELEVQAAPGERGKELLEIALGLLDGAAAREAPARRQPMDVRIDGEGRLTEGLLHHDARGLVAHARQGFEGLECGRHAAAVLFDQDPREPRDRLRLGWRESARADDAPDLGDGEPAHRFGRRRAGEQQRRDLVHLDVGALRGEQHGDEQRVGIPMVEEDLDLGVDLVEDATDPTGFVRALHGAASIDGVGSAGNCEAARARGAHRGQR
jgi:hypothetical protein